MEKQLSVACLPEEVRRCLTEGLARADYLLPAKVQAERGRSSEERHDRNYWSAMKRVGDAFRGRK